MLPLRLIHRQAKRQVALLLDDVGKHAQDIFDQLAVFLAAECVQCARFIPQGPSLCDRAFMLVHHHEQPDHYALHRKVPLFVIAFSPDRGG